MSDLWDEQFFSESLLEKEYRAWAMLQWSPGSSDEPFLEDKAQRRFYSQAWTFKSDQAIQQFDELNGFRDQSMSELDCFKELERLGILSQADFYLPSNADKSVYSKRLKEHRNATGSTGQGKRGVEVPHQADPSKAESPSQGAAHRHQAGGEAELFAALRRGTSRSRRIQGRFSDGTAGRGFSSGPTDPGRD